MDWWGSARELRARPTGPQANEMSAAGIGDRPESATAHAVALLALSGLWSSKCSRSLALCQITSDGQIPNQISLSNLKSFSKQI